MLKFAARYDWILFAAIALLSAIGFLMLVSISLGEVLPAARIVAVGNMYRQVLSILVSVAAVWVLSLIDYRIIRESYWVAGAAAIVMLVAVLVVGSTIRGSRGWFVVGPIQFQPVEFAKVAYLLLLARFLSLWARHIGQLKHVLASMVLTGLFVALVIPEPAFGSAILFILVWLTSIFFVGIPRRHIVLLITTGAVIAWITFAFVLRPYQRARLTTFFNPERDPYGQGYNRSQSLIAIGSGGFFGKGFALGTQSQLHFLPERQTDFIFAVFAEEFGFVGVVVMIGLWLVVLWRLWYWAKTVRDEFSMFYMTGLVTLLLWEIVIPIGMNSGLLPVTGLTLPFVSYGGSSYLMHAIMIGIAASMMRHHSLFLKAETGE